jgi:hypothetical protein
VKFVKSPFIIGPCFAGRLPNWDGKDDHCIWSSCEVALALTACCFSYEYMFYIYSSRKCMHLKLQHSCARIWILETLLKPEITTSLYFVVFTCASLVFYLYWKLNKWLSSPVLSGFILRINKNITTYTHEKATPLYFSPLLDWTPTWCLYVTVLYSAV